MRADWAGWLVVDSNAHYASAAAIEFFLKECESKQSTHPEGTLIASYMQRFASTTLR